MITQQQTLATWLEEVPEALILASPHGEIIHANLRAQTTLSIDIVKHPLLSDLFDAINPEADNITRLLIRLRPSEEKRTMMRYKPEPFRAFNIAVRRSNQSDYVILSLREEVDVLEKFSSIKHELETYRLLAHNLPNSAVILFDRDMRYLVCDGPALSKAEGMGAARGSSAAALVTWSITEAGAELDNPESLSVDQWGFILFFMWILTRVRKQ